MEKDILPEILTREKPLLIAIDGRCAAGKTTLAAGLQAELGCEVISMDSFFLRPEQRTAGRLEEPGGNVDRERFRDEVMLPLRGGEKFSYRPFDCVTMTFGEEITVTPGDITIIEGSYCCHPSLWDLYGLRIFMDVRPEEQLRRIRVRNGAEALAVFRDKWIPLEEKYFAAYRIKERCDIVREWVQAPPDTV